MLEHGRAVAEGHRSELVAQVLPVHLFGVGAADEEVIDQLPAARPRREVEVEGAVEASGPHERRVEGVGPVGGADHEDVAVGNQLLLELAVGWQVVVDAHLEEVGEALGPVGVSRRTAAGSAAR